MFESIAHPSASGSNPLALEPAALRRCGACQGSFPLDLFSFKSRARGTYASKCKPCVNAYSAQHFRDNTEAYVAKAAAHTVAYRERNRALREEALEGQACVGCGAVHDLTFYTGPGHQGQPVHMAVNAGLGQAAVLDAIGKATVVCRGCLSVHFATPLHVWHQLTTAERKVLQAACAERGGRQADSRRYKAYRKLGRSQAAALCASARTSAPGLDSGIPSCGARAKVDSQP